MSYQAFVATLLIVSNVGAQTAPKLDIVPQLELAYTPAPLLAVPAGDDKIAYVKQGEPVPFTGQLFSPETALRWAHFLQQSKLRLREDVVAERRMCQAYLSYMGKQVQLEKEYNVAVETDLRDRVLGLEQRNSDLGHKIQNPSFFKSPAFWFGAGVVFTGLAVGLGAVLVSEVK